MEWIRMCILAVIGANVILACRNLTKGESAADDIKRSTSNDLVVVRKLDLSSLVSVRNFATTFMKEEKRLDVLVNNAGVGLLPKWETEDGFDMTFGVNHLGHFLLTNLLLDLLKKSAPSRIINVSSRGYKFVDGINFDDVHQRKGEYGSLFAYGQSKLANILFSLELSKRLKGTGVTANSLHPGAINTELDRYSHQSSVILPSVTVPLIRLLIMTVGKTVEQGAQTTLYLAVDESISKTSGVYFDDCAPVELPEYAKNETAARQLWELSAKEVGLQKKLE